MHDSPKLTLRTEGVPWSDIAGTRPLLEGFLSPGGPSRELLPPSAADVEAVAARRGPWLDAHLNRSVLCETLCRDLEAWGAPEAAIRGAEALGESGTWAVVTGQQAGLLTGPLYTIYKAIGAIHWAARLSGQMKARVVPVFWMASEDHDLDEIRWLEWLSAEGGLVRHEADLNDVADRCPASGIPADRIGIEAILSRRAAVIRESEFTSGIDDLLREAAHGAASWSDAFARLMLRLLGDRGLVVVDASSPGLRGLVRDIFEREIADPLASTVRVAEATEQLRAAGYDPSLHKAADRCSFFLMDEGRRLGVRHDGQIFHAGDGSYAAEALVERLASRPEDFSPAAALRPVVQDRLLPTLLTVLGPGEIAYHSQIGGVYERHGVPRPCVTLRPGLTVIERPVQRRLEKYGLAWRDLLAEPESLARRVAASEALDAVRGALARVRVALEAETETLRQSAAAIDPGLQQPVEKDLDQIVRALDHLEDLAVRRAAQQDGKALSDLRQMREALFPGGEPQERRLNLFYFLYKYGRDWMTALEEALGNVRPGEHGVARVETRREETP